MKKEASGEKKTKKSVIKRIVDVILTLFLIFAFVITVIAIASLNNGDRIPNIGGTSLMTVSSGSMEPVFSEGDLILVQTLSDEEKYTLEVDDVVTFLDEDLTDGDNLVFTTHRIVEVIKDDNGNVTGYRTRGDAVGYDDNTIRKVSDMRGLYNGKCIKGVGTAVAFLRSPTGFLICIVIPLIIAFIYQIIAIVKYIIDLKNKGKKMITEEDEEAIKRKAVEEYLRQQAEAKASSDSEGDSENK